MTEEKNHIRAGTADRIKEIERSIIKKYRNLSGAVLQRQSGNMN